MAVYEHDDVTLAYDDTGAGTPIVFLHGLSMSRATWERFLPDLDGFRVVRLDQRGHGGSSHAGTYVLDSYVADTIAFLESVVGEPATLVGHSLGGVIAHEIARRRPDLVKSVLLEDPPLYVHERIGTDGASPVAAFFPMAQQLTRDMQARDAPLEEYEGLFRAMPALNGRGTFADVVGTGLRAYAEAFSQLDPEIFTPAIDGSAIRWAAGDETLACPAVLLRADPAFGPAFAPTDEARFLAANPGARVVMIESASHAIHDEEPIRFADELRAIV